ncbi:MAG: hypothetical protein AABY93_10580 [Bacteroidota bacterium]
MKKVVSILSILFCLSTLGYSQFNKGRFLAGGSINSKWSNVADFGAGFTGQFYSIDGQTFSINLYPQVGYFFAKNFAAGAGLNLGTKTVKIPEPLIPPDDQTKYTTNTISFEPFARFYFLKNFYSQASFNVGIVEQKEAIFGGSYDNYKTKGWSLAAGYAYLLNEHVAIEPQIGYGADIPKSGQKVSRDLFFKVGIQVYLGK